MPVNDSLTLSIFILYVFNVGERILSTILVHTMHNPLAKSNPSSMGKVKNYSVAKEMTMLFCIKGL